MAPGLGRSTRSESACDATSANVSLAVVDDQCRLVVHQAQGVQSARLTKAAIHHNEVIAAARGRDRLHVRA
eukprot:scaffold24655_cov75-Phaeocystis_antarctica.AAC.2